MSMKANRRDFLRYSSVAGAAATGTGVWTGSSTDAEPSKRWLNEQLQFASIGVGGKGRSDTEQANAHGVTTAICDCDDKMLDSIVRLDKFKESKRYNDFRLMFSEMGDSIDAVTVSTPDHTHAPASMMAMRMGKHVYCQKPLTHSVYEARMMREAAQGYKVATQMGNQGTAEDGLRRAVEIIRDGVIGPVREVHVWTNRPVWPQAPKVTARPTEVQTIPDHVHWDMFLGPAPDRPYHAAYHPFKWRGWWDFGTGALGDMACHTANMAFMALDLGYPTSVSAVNGEINPETFPAWATITFEFPARGTMPPVKFVWYEGKTPDGKKNLPSPELLQGQNPPGSGSLLVGDNGTVYSPNDYGARYMLLPSKDFEGYEGPEPYLPRNGKKDAGMKAEWVTAIHGGPAAFSNFNYAGLLTETILLGNIAMRTGEKLMWDGPNLRFSNSKSANSLLHREYREGWTL